MQEKEKKFNSNEKISSGKKHEIDLMKSELDKSKKKEYEAKEILIHSHSNWTNLSYDILQISKDLYSCLQKSIAGQEYSSEIFNSASDKILKYEQFLQKKLKDLSLKFNPFKSSIKTNSPYQFHNKSKLSENDKNINSSNISRSLTSMNEKLDYQKIKNSFLKDNYYRVAGIINALSRRLIKYFHNSDQKGEMI